MGLITALYFLSNMMWGSVYCRVVKRHKKVTLRNQAKENGHEDGGEANGHAKVSIAKKSDDAEKESTI